MLHDPTATLPPSDDDTLQKRRRTALERLREHRRRKAEGVGLFVVEENWGDMADALRQEEDEEGNSRLLENEEEDREAIRRAFAKKVREWIAASKA
jgi:hypothetical protein